VGQIDPNNLIPKEHQKDFNKKEIDPLTIIVWWPGCRTSINWFLFMVFFAFFSIFYIYMLHITYKVKITANFE